MAASRREGGGGPCHGPGAIGRHKQPHGRRPPSTVVHEERYARGEGPGADELGYGHKCEHGSARPFLHEFDERSQGSLLRVGVDVVGSGSGRHRVQGDGGQRKAGADGPIYERHGPLGEHKAGKCRAKHHAAPLHHRELLLDHGNPGGLRHCPRHGLDGGKKDRVEGADKDCGHREARHGLGARASCAKTRDENHRRLESAGYGRDPFCPKAVCEHSSGEQEQGSWEAADAHDRTHDHRVRGQCGRIPRQAEVIGLVRQQSDRIGPEPSGRVLG